MAARSQLIIDGYNVIHADPALKAVFRASREDARREFERLVLNYSAVEGLEVEIVYDGTSRSSRPVVSGTLTVTFTGQGRSADAYIEKRACSVTGDDTGRLTVVTADYRLQMIVIGAGHLRKTPGEFFDDIEEARGPEEF